MCHLAPPPLAAVPANGRASTKPAPVAASGMYAAMNAAGEPSAACQAGDCQHARTGASTHSTTWPQVGMLIPATRGNLVVLGLPGEQHTDKQSCRPKRKALRLMHVRRAATRVHVDPTANF